MSDDVEHDLNDFHGAWWFLNEHPAFFHPKNARYNIYNEAFVSACLEIEVQKVCPKTRHIESDVSRNTMTEVWLECGPFVIHEGKITASHDWDLDCGAETFEEAIIILAKKVKEKYGDIK